MKTNFTVLLLVLVFCVSVNSSYAQSIELNSPQDLTVSFSGFFPFSDEANQSFKDLIDQNGSVAIIIKNFMGKGLNIAPAADFREIGKKKKIKGDTIIIIDYKKKKAKKFGLSFVPKGAVSANFEVQPFAERPCPNPVNCQDDCGENLGKCCEKDSGGSQSRMCIQIGTSSCGCAKR